MTRVRNTENWSKEEDSRPEFNLIPSMTVQHHNLSIADLLAKHTRGVSVFRKGRYADDEEFTPFDEINLDTLDPMEKADLKRDLDVFVKQQRETLSKKKEAAPPSPPPSNNPEDLAGL